MDLITKLADYGVSYLLLAISLVANVVFLKHIKFLYEKRLDDLRTIQSSITDPLKKIQEADETQQKTNALVSETLIKIYSLMQDKRKK